MSIAGARPAAVALACSAGLAMATPEPALAKGTVERDALVACAWAKVPTTAAALIAKAKFDRRYVYDADGSPTVGALMRVYAACEAEKAAYLADRASRTEDTRAFLRRLKAARPRTVGADSFAEPVFRCEFRFTDWSDAREPAAIAWGHGSDQGAQQLAATKTVFGTRTSISATDFASNERMAALLAESQRQSEQAVEVASYAEGEALNKPFVVSKDGKRSCRRVAPSGEFENA